MQQRFPGLTADAGDATVVFVAPEGSTVTAERYKSAIESAVRRLAEGDQVAMVDDPFEAGAVSGDGSAAYASVRYAVKANAVTDASVAEIDAAADVARQAGLTVEAGGSAMEPGGGGGVAEIIAIGLSPGATKALIAQFLATPRPGTAGPPPATPGIRDLTDREREVMTMAADGKSNDEIARELHLSVLTVRTHVQRAMTKLGARDRAQLVVLAYKNGLVSPGSGTA